MGHPAAIAVSAEKIVFLEMLGEKTQNPLLGLRFGHVGASVNRKCIELCPGNALGSSFFFFFWYEKETDA